MSRFRLVHVTSRSELRDVAPAWDDLWWRSDVARPTVRAELVAQWLEQFAPRAPFHALVVEDRGQWVAALPLVRGSRCRLLRTGGLPSNGWSPNGELLLDPHADVDAALDVLVAAMRGLSWPLLWLDDVTLGLQRWQALVQAVQRAGMAFDCREHWQLPWIEIGRDWQACQQQWSKKHLGKMQKAVRRLAEQGDLQLEVHSHLAPSQVEPLLRNAFEIEDLGWKGEGGTSVLRTPGMFEFFLRQAEQLAQWGQWELSFLKMDARPIAFVYGFCAKGVSHWHKIGYDPQYRCSTPGQLLQYHLLERLHREGDCRAVDCIGPLTDALSKWKPVAYPVGRLLIAPRRWLGRIVLHACKHWWPRVRRLLGRRQASAPSKSDGQAAPAHADEPTTAPV